MSSQTCNCPPTRADKVAQLSSSLQAANISPTLINQSLRPLGTAAFSTDMDLNAVFGNGRDKISLLPSVTPVTPTAGDRDANGLLTETAANAHVQTLIRQGIIPVYTGKNNTVVEQKQKTLLANSKEEFDFYYVRYAESLRRLFEQVNKNATSPSKVAQDSITEQVKITRQLNIKLNDLVQIIIALTRYIQSNTTQLNQNVATFAQKIEDEKQKLVHQHKMISSDEAASNLSKEMVKYTEQKARYTDNLLSVYSVLNIVALGLLVYVFRSTTE
uniref:Uncharacterized protein n=1 Tax=viral metagenome TaxID=1070528 RepID=A0A6C0KNQ0_9ZZZZ